MCTGKECWALLGYGRDKCFIFLESTNLTSSSIISPQIQSLIEMHKLTNSNSLNQTWLSLFGGNCDFPPQFSPRHAPLPLRQAVREQSIP